MFGFFKRKQAAKSKADPTLHTDLRLAVGPLLIANEAFSAEIAESYGGLKHNPAELRFFTMAATSIFVQTFGELPQEKMQALVGEFYQLSAANLLLHMPRADFSLVHEAATSRFGQYADHIIVFSKPTLPKQFKMLVWSW